MHARKSYILLGLLLLLSLVTRNSYAENFTNNYSDIEGHWAESSLLVAVEKGYIKGFQDRSLRPNQPMERAEFIRVIAELIEDRAQTSGKPSRFKDHAQNYWAAPYITELEQTGILDTAFPGDVLEPTKTITREEAASILDSFLIYHHYSKAIHATNKNYDFAKNFMIDRANIGRTFEKLSFKDASKVRSELLPSVLSLHRKGIMNGVEKDEFGPKEGLDRAQAVSIVLRALGEEPKQFKVEQVEVVEQEGKRYLKDTMTGLLLKRQNFNGGLVRTSNNAYYIDFDGSLKSGFFTIENKTYYTEEDKGLARGWRTIGNEGKLYYFSPIDNRMYKNGIYSTGEGAYWFGADGSVQSGKRKGGHTGKYVEWKMPSPMELTNAWLEGENQQLRFRGQEIANFAASFEGRPFHWFGCDLYDTKGIYCCGTVYSAYKAFGITIPGPKDMDPTLNDGYEMVRQQHERIQEFGGQLIPNDFSKLLPGDIILHKADYSPIDFAHVGIYLGFNGGKPFYIHATLLDGLIAEDAYMVNEKFDARFSDSFMRYNTEQNKGHGKYPKW